MASQLDNFRKSLGLPQRNEGEHEYEKIWHKGKTKRTVMVKEESYLRFRALTLWLVREAKMQRPTFDDVFKLGLEAYLEKEPAAREYVEQACGKQQLSVSPD